MVPSHSEPPWESLILIPINPHDTHGSSTIFTDDDRVPQDSHNYPYEFSRHRWFHQWLPWLSMDSAAPGLQDSQSLRDGRSFVARCCGQGHREAETEADDGMIRMINGHIWCVCTVYRTLCIDRFWFLVIWGFVVDYGWEHHCKLIISNAHRLQHSDSRSW